MEGFKVGLVRTITYDYSTTGRILVEINLEKGMRINRGSYVALEKTLLSGAEMHIQLNKYVDEYLQSGDTIEGRQPEDMISTVQNEMLPQVMALLPKLDSILTGLQALVNNPALAQSLDNIERTTAGLEQSSRQLNRLLQKDVPTIAGNLTTASANFSALSGDLRTLDLNGTVNSLNQTLGNLNQTTAKLNSKDNSMGLLLNDSLLYNNLNRTVNSANGLLIDFKEHPKRYVRFSLF